jgi:purine-binding chemotaxis protein CheW
MNDEMIMFCTFEAAGRFFGVPLTDIKEITAEINCTRIPHSPESVRGYVNIRGQIILGIDLKRMLKLPIAENDEAKRMVIFKQTVGPAFGLLVDEIGEIASVSRREMEDSKPVANNIESHSPSGLIERVCKLTDRLLVVLNPRKFLPIVEKEIHRTNT